MNSFLFNEKTILHYKNSSDPPLRLRRLEGQLSVLPNCTNSPKIFHIIKDFHLNIKTIFKSTSFHNLLQLRVLYIKSKLKLEKNKLNNNLNVKRNRKHIDSIKFE